MQPVLVAVDQFGEGVLLAGHVGGQEFGVAACCCGFGADHRADVIGRGGPGHFTATRPWG